MRQPVHGVRPSRRELLRKNWFSALKSTDRDLGRQVESRFIACTTRRRLCRKSSQLDGVDLQLAVHTEDWKKCFERRNSLETGVGQLDMSGVNARLVP